MPGLPLGRLLLGLGLVLALCTFLRNHGSQTSSLGSLPATLIPPLSVHPPPADANTPPSALGKLKRVAVIGAGASGSAAAFFLERAARSTEGEGEVELVVFERDGRVGGRSMTVRPYGPDGSRGEGENNGEGKIVELGASIFVSPGRVRGSLVSLKAQQVADQRSDALLPHQVEAKCVFLRPTIWLSSD